jgi:5'-3' exoribonuclease 2
LPHLPSLDIRDGALDFLMEVYKELLPSLGTYLTSPGGNVNLSAVDVLMARVSEVEDIVFRKRKEADDEQLRRRNAQDARNANNNSSSNSSAKFRAGPTHGQRSRPIQDAASPPFDPVSSAVPADNKIANQLAAQRLRESMLGKRTFSQSSADQVNSTEAAADTDADSISTNMSEAIAAHVNVSDEIKKRLKEKENQLLDECRSKTVDAVRLHEEGWKERYYADPPKRDDLQMGGGKQRMCETYVQGLCWVLKYYYQV